MTKFHIGDKVKVSVPHHCADGVYRRFTGWIIDIIESVLSDSPTIYVIAHIGGFYRCSENELRLIQTQGGEHEKSPL